MNFNWKNSRQTWLLTFAGLCVFAFAVYMYKFERDRDLNEVAGLNQVGSVVTSENDVRRRPRSRLLWVELPTEAKIYERDTIRTGPGSMARIDLGKYGSIELRGESLIVIEPQGDGLQVNVASGDLALRGNLSAKIGDTKITGSDNSSVQLRASSGGKSLKIESKGGRVQVTTNGKTTDIQQGQQLEKSAQGEIQVKSFSLSKTYPPEGKSITLKRGAPIQLQVKKTAPVHLKNKDLKIEVARDLDFHKLEKIIPLGSKEFEQQEVSSIQTALPPGKYFWRVVNVEKIGKKVKSESQSSTGSFEVVEASEFRWAPHHGSMIKGVVDNTGVSFDTNWETVPEAQQYHGRVLLNGKAILKSDPLSDNKWSVKEWKDDLYQKLKNGALADTDTLEVEIQTLNSSGKELLSPARLGLLIVDRRPPQNPALATLNPLPDQPTRSIIETKFSDKTSMNSNAFYELKSGSINLKSDKPQFELDTIQAADALQKDQLQIRAVGVSGDVGEWIPISGDVARLEYIRKFSAAPNLLYPSTDSRILYVAGQKLTLRWTPVGDEKKRPEKYLVTLAKSKDKTQVFETKEPAYQTSLPQTGAWSWSVQAKWKDLGLGPKSATYNFSIVRGATLAPPNITRRKLPTERSPASTEKSKPTYEEDDDLP